MAHPKMYDEDDPIYQRVSELALSFPEADMKVSHGRPAFFTKKIFAMYGASLKVDGEWVQHPQSITLMPEASERAALEDDPRFWVPAYWGPWGWLAMDLDADSDWDEVTELVDASFRLTAPARAVKALDAASSSD